MNEYQHPHAVITPAADLKVGDCLQTRAGLVTITEVAHGLISVIVDTSHGTLVFERDWNVYAVPAINV
jgi:hypothetical protein